MDKRITEQKMIILEAFRHLDHPTAEELWRYIQKQHPNFSRATMYRNLAKYVQDGVVARVCITEDIRYETNVNKHIHVVCSSCNKIQDVNFNYPIVQPKTLLGYNIHGYELFFKGTCPKCQENED